MNKIIDYEIITSDDWEYVVRNVKLGLLKGWQPLNGIQLSSYVNVDGESFTYYAQAMVLHEDSLK